jgi:hypothetical protein
MSKKRKPRNRRGQQQGANNKPPSTPPLPPSQVPLAPANVNQQPKPPLAQERTDEKRDDDAEELTGAVDRNTRINTWLAGAVAVATIIQAGVSYWQLSAMDRGLNQTDATLELMRQDQRPWIAVEPPTMKDFIAGKSPIIVAKISNVGRTPAKILARKSRMVIAYSIDHLEQLVEPLTDPEFDSAEGIVHSPGGETKWTMYDLGPISEDDFKRVEKGTTAVYLLFAIVYTDIGNPGKRLITQGCFEYVPETSEFSINDRYWNVQ